MAACAFAMQQQFYRSAAESHAVDPRINIWLIPLWAPSIRSLRFTQRSAFDLGGRKSAKRHSMASYLFDFNSTGLRG